VHLPLSSPALRFIPLGFLHSGLMDFVFFDDVPSSYPAFALPRLEHLHGRQHSPQRPSHRRPGTRFAVRENTSTGHGRFLYSLSFFERLPSSDKNAFTDSFYGKESGIPILLLFSLLLDWLAPYCFSTFLARTHNYLAGIHNNFVTIRTMTTVPHGLPLGGWYCTISFLFFECAATIAGSFGLPRTSIVPSLVTPALNIQDLLKWLLCVCFLFFLCSDDRAMSFPDSSCLFFDLIPFVYLLS